MNLEGTSTGYANFIHKGDFWLLRFGPTPEQRQNIARVRSRCIPEMFYSSNPQGNEIRHSAWQLMIAGFDDEGRQLSGFSALWASDLGPADDRDVVSGGVHIHQEVDVPVGAVSLRLGIEDQMSNHLGTVELPLPVPAPADVPRTVRHSLPEIEPDTRDRTGSSREPDPASAL